MELMNPNDLKSHPRNGEFFDDMDGQKWKDFLQSVRTSGIIEPIIVTQDLTVVSGHQRIRAAKAVGLLKVAVEIRHYDDDDKVLKDLIETNIMQRGIGNTNPIKLAKCIVELERIEGIRNGSANEKGNNRVGDGHNVGDKTQSDLAEQLKMSQKQLSRYKKLLDLIPELQSAVEDGKISATNASAILAKLPEDEQKAIAEKIVGSDGKVSKRELEFYKKRAEELTAQNNELLNKKPEVVERVVEKVVEVPSEELVKESEDLKRKNADLQTDYRNLRNQYEGMTEKWKKSEKEKQALVDEMKKPETERAENIKRSAISFCAGVSNFIEKYGGYVWLADSLNEMEKSEREGYRKAVNALEGWLYQMKQNMEG